MTPEERDDIVERVARRVVELQRKYARLVELADVINNGITFEWKELEELNRLREELKATGLLNRGHNEETNKHPNGN